MDRITRKVLDIYETEKGTKKGTWSCSKFIDKERLKITSLGKKHFDYSFICLLGTQAKMGSQAKQVILGAGE